MKYLLLFLLTASSLFGLDSLAIPITYQDSAVLTHTQLNRCNDTTEIWTKTLIDTLDGEFMRFKDFENDTRVMAYSLS